METKGERTRRRIIDEAAPLLNERGYHAATLEDLMAVTGLRKGGIYNHFASREELVLAAYDRNTSIVRAQISDALARSRNAADRLRGVVDVYVAFAVDPPFPGGCPTLNSAVQSCGTDPRLHARAREIVHELLDDLFTRIVRAGVRRGELRTVDAAAEASVFVAAIEGALLLTELLDDPTHMVRVAAHLHDHIDAISTSEENPT